MTSVSQYVSDNNSEKYHSGSLILEPLIPTNGEFSKSTKDDSKML